MHRTCAFGTVILVAAALAGPAAARPAQCYLHIGNVVYIDGPCDFDNFGGDGSFQISAYDGSYFAVVSIVGRGRAEGWWNGSTGGTHAHEALGGLVRNDACWSNGFAVVCAW